MNSNVVEGKKGTELTLQAIVIFILCIIVLVVVIMFFLKHYKGDAVLQTGTSAIDVAKSYKS